MTPASSVRFRSIICGLILLAAAHQARAQGVQQAAQENLIAIARGTSVLLTQPTAAVRVSIGDPEVADAVVVTPRDVLVNGKTLGSTTLIVWDAAGNRRIYNIEVTADAGALQRQFQALFPGQNITVTASGNIVVLSGRVTDSGIAGRAFEIARATGATVVDNLVAPPSRQILLQVRFAEVSRNAATRLGTDIRVGETGINLNPDVIDGEGDHVARTLSDGLVQLFLFEGSVQVDAVINALKSRSMFRSLAEPNLLAIEGKEASFLAGGEFPYPIPQAGGTGNTVTIVFKEFGIRLRFKPVITVAGNIRLEVAPEVSSLDFSNGLILSGFRIPSLLTRRAETEIELKDGQTFAIAGLLDNSLLNSTTKIPFLGDIPILGSLFRSKDVRQDRTELLVLVTPHVVTPTDVSPPIPTGEPEEWKFDRQLRGPANPAAKQPAEIHGRRQ